MKQKKIKPKMVLDNDGKPVTDAKKVLSDFLNYEWNEFVKIRTEIEILPADEPKEWTLGWTLGQPIILHDIEEEPELIVIKNRS